MKLIYWKLVEIWFPVAFMARATLNKITLEIVLKIGSENLDLY